MTWTQHWHGPPRRPPAQSPRESYAQSWAFAVRRVRGDLTGLASVKFDVADHPARRFRLVYADLDARTRGVLAIGVRDEHATYRLAVERIGALEALDADTDDAD